MVNLHGCVIYKLIYVKYKIYFMENMQFNLREIYNFTYIKYTIYPWRKIQFNLNLHFD